MFQLNKYNSVVLHYQNISYVIYNVNSILHILLRLALSQRQHENSIFLWA